MRVKLRDEKSEKVAAYITADGRNAWAVCDILATRVKGRDLFWLKVPKVAPAKGSTHISVLLEEKSYGKAWWLVFP